MTLGELILAILIIIIFCLGIWGGLKLFRWNMQDRKQLQERNKKRMQQK